MLFSLARRLFTEMTMSLVATDVRQWTTNHFDDGVKIHYGFPYVHKQTDFILRKSMIVNIYY